ncbi:SUKH-3 domain-containing protein [Brevibacillus sp. 179-C9.3 HS]|uniref:SUKH-3 domain-containing protein n=1 Tax=unclassified Brevibacillus TaxID=2684853 RepID=UPI0039A1F77C
MGLLSKQTLQILTESGWHPGRSVHIQSTIDFLEAKGYQVFPCVRDALKEFSGLTCRFKRPNGDSDSFHFNPEEAYGDYYEIEDFLEIEKRINEPVIAIGQASNEYMMLFMSESGKVFGEMGYCMVKYGNDIYEALDALCFVLPVEKMK